MNRLWRFGNAVVALDKVLAVHDDMVLLEGGHWVQLGKAACKAIVEAMPFYRGVKGRTEAPRQDADEADKEKAWATGRPGA